MKTIRKVYIVIPQMASKVHSLNYVEAKTKIYLVPLTPFYTLIAFSYTRQVDHAFIYFVLF